jgi:hypothetical protein
VRAQFSSRENIRLMQESIAICREFAGEMKINVWFRQGGYLFLTRSAAERADALEGASALQNRCGLATRLLDPARGHGAWCPSSTCRASCGELQPRRRGGLPLALRLGLRPRRARPRRARF